MYEEKNDSDCYDCEAPKLTKVEVHITQTHQRILLMIILHKFLKLVIMFGILIKKHHIQCLDDTVTPIVADPGDEVEIILELTDNRTLERIYR